MTKAYISGAITGLDLLAPAFFNRAEEFLKSKGFDAINPLKLNHNHDKSWESYMRIDLQELLKCNCIYMLKNFTTSRGAMIELQVAHTVGMHVMFESEFCVLQNLNKAEAWEALNQGHKITHKYFADNEWIRKKSEYELINQEGIVMSQAEFLLERTAEYFNTGWEIIY